MPEIRSSGQAQENIEEFAKKYIEMLKLKEEVMDDIKALKQEFKEEGVPVQIVTSVLNKIKAAKKKTESQIFEEDTIKGWLVENAEIDNGIGELAAR